MDTRYHVTRVCFTAALATTVACSALNGALVGPEGKAAVASVTLDADSIDIMQIRAYRFLTAVAKDSRGKVIKGKTITWSSSAPLIVRVDHGQCYGLDDGAAVITATVDGKSAHAKVTVGATPSTVVFATQPYDIAVGEVFVPPIRVELRNLDGRVVTSASDTVFVVTLALPVSSCGLLGGCTEYPFTRVTAVRGVATFDQLTVTAPGLYRLGATLSSGWWTATASDVFTVSAP